MEPTQVLRDEHRLIERMLKVLEAACQKAERGDMRPPIFEKAVDFIKNYADRNHHGKEEDILYTTLPQYGIPKEGGPIAVMLYEHDDGRKFVKGLVEATESYQKGNQAALKAMVSNARGYANLMGQHIPKEDGILYPMSEAVLPPKAKEELARQFAEADKKVFTPALREGYLRAVAELEHELGLNSK